MTPPYLLAPAKAQLQLTPGTASDDSADGRGVRTQLLPGTDNIAIVVETSKGACPIFCIVDERWLDLADTMQLIRQWERWLDLRDPVEPQAPPPAKLELRAD